MFFVLAMVTVIAVHDTVIVARLPHITREAGATIVQDLAVIHPVSIPLSPKPKLVRFPPPLSSYHCYACVQFYFISVTCRRKLV